MAFANPIPAWAFALVAVAAVALSWLVYRGFSAAPPRRYLLIALRSVTLIALVIFLMRPVIRHAGDGTRDAVVPILVDTSRSMSIEDADGRTRIDAARDALDRQILPALAERFTVETLAFGERVSPSSSRDLAAAGRRSDLAEAIAAVRERYRGRPVAGILLLSDGGDTSGTGEREILRDAIAPVFPLGFGSRTVGRDREVLSVTVADPVLDDSRVDLAVSAVSHGHGADPIELRLLENGRPIEVRRVTPAGDGTPVRAVFNVAPAPGAPSVYTIEIPAASGELVPENNSRSALVPPPSRGRRILFVEGAPGFEHSFLKRAWALDRGIEIDAVVRKGRNEDGTDTFYIQAARDRGDRLTSGYPSRAEDLFAYDAVVLANVDGSQLSRAQLDLTREFVARRGGGLLVMGAQALGRSGLLETSLDEALPLLFSERGDLALPASNTRGVNRVAITAPGLQHPIMQLGSTDDTAKRWDAVPPLAAIAPLGGPRPGASVLAVTGGPGGTPRALVAVQRYGDGRSMIFTGEASWRWRMMLPSTDRSYDTFWRQAIRWLSLGAGEPMAISAAAGGAPGDTLPLRVLVRDAAFTPQRGAQVDVRVTAPDGRIDTVSAAASGDEYSARFRPDHPGVYKLTVEAKAGTRALGTATTSVLVGGSDLEMTDPRLNQQLLDRLATSSGGRVLDAAALASLGDTLAAGVPAARLAVQRDAWHTVWSFLAILVLLAAEWILRRRWGLR